MQQLHAILRRKNLLYQPVCMKRLTIQWEAYACGNPLRRFCVALPLFSFFHSLLAGGLASDDNFASVTTLDPTIQYRSQRVPGARSLGPYLQALTASQQMKVSHEVCRVMTTGVKVGTLMVSLSLRSPLSVCCDYGEMRSVFNVIGQRGSIYSRCCMLDGMDFPYIVVSFRVTYESALKARIGLHQPSLRSF